MEEFSSPAAGEREGNAPRCVFEFHNRFLNKSSSPKARCWVIEMTDLILDTPLPEEEQSWLPMDLGWTRRPRGGHIDGVEDRPLLRGSRQKLRQRVGVSIVSLNVVKKKKKKGRREATLVLRMVTTEASRAAGVRDGERGAVRF